VHSSGYDDGENWKGKKALVIGTGNSGHDHRAEDLFSSGAEVTPGQRSSTLIVSIEPSAQLVYSPYNEGTLDDNDLIAVSMPLKLARKSHALTSDKSRELDQDLLAGLERVGFKLDFGEDNTGWQFKYLTRGGGYYFNVGLLGPSHQGRDQAETVCRHRSLRRRRREAEGRRNYRRRPDRAGDRLQAPGRTGAKAVRRDGRGTRRHHLGIFGDTQELRNMYVRTGQPGLWFIAGGLAQCRIGSKQLALQIKAIEEGLLPAARSLQVRS